LCRARLADDSVASVREEIPAALILEIVREEAIVKHGVILHPVDRSRS
jgi:hypothetical protein